MQPHSRPLTRILALFALVTLGAGSPDAAAEALVPAPQVSKVDRPPRPWKEMNARDRGKYMKKVVVPRMRVVFQAFDPKQFKKFDCATCHGNDADDRKFKMPSPDLHALPPTPAAFEAKLKTEPKWPRWTKFMSEQVQPQMAALLGLPAFNHEKPQAGGFSCGNCHTLSKS